MTFEDLPANWPDYPLSDTSLAADIVDLIVGESDRDAGCISLLCCDGDHRLLHPITMTEIPENSAARREVFDLVFTQLGSCLGAVVVAIGRARTGELDDLTRAWHQAAVDACNDHDVILLGTYLASPGQVHELPTWFNLRDVG